MHPNHPESEVSVCLMPGSPSRTSWSWSWHWNSDGSWDWDQQSPGQGADGPWDQWLQTPTHQTVVWNGGGGQKDDDDGDASMGEEADSPSGQVALSFVSHFKTLTWTKPAGWAWPGVCLGCMCCHEMQFITSMAECNFLFVLPRWAPWSPRCCCCCWLPWQPSQWLCCISMSWVGWASFMLSDSSCPLFWGGSGDAAGDAAGSSSTLVPSGFAAYHWIQWYLTFGGFIYAERCLN